MKTRRACLWVGCAAAVAAASSALASENLPYCVLPLADTMIDRLQQHVNFGDSDTLLIRDRIPMLTHEGSFEISSLVKFDLGSIPEGTTIASAKLHFYYYTYQFSDPAGRDLMCYRITERWKEQIVTWVTQPKTAADATGGTAVPAERENWFAFDVTQDVQAILDGERPNHGWMIKDEHAGEGDPLRYPQSSNVLDLGDPCTCMRSKEFGNLVPYLLIETTCPADVDGSGSIDLVDLLSLLAGWGACP